MPAGEDLVGPGHRRADRIAITGVGMVSPLGSTADTTYAALLGGECGVSTAPWQEPGDERPGWFAPVHSGFEPRDWLDQARLDGTDRFVTFGLAAVHEAVTGAQLTPDHGQGLDPLRTAVVDSTSMGGFYSLMRAQAALARGGIAAIPTKTMMQVWGNMSCAQVAMRYKLHGPALTVNTACAGSLDAVGQGARLIREGLVDVALCGGTEGGFPSGPDGGSDFVPVTSPGAALIGVESSATDSRLASLPFDVRRSGIVFGEGAAWLVLESEAHATRRNATVRAWLEGYASCADSYHPVAPDPSGRWEAHAMDLARSSAGLSASDIALVVAHGTGTPKGDAAEAAALARSFGQVRPAVTSLKGHLGHTGASSGAMSMIAAIEMMDRREVIPTRGTTEIDPGFDLDLKVGSVGPLAIGRVQVNAFGFGGQDASLVLSGGS